MKISKQTIKLTKLFIVQLNLSIYIYLKDAPVSKCFSNKQEDVFYIIEGVFLGGSIFLKFLSFIFRPSQIKKRNFSLF